MRKIILFHLLLFSFIAKAQDVSHHCAFDRHVDMHQSRYNDWDVVQDRIENEINLLVNAPVIQQRSVITIPVVVHLLYTDESQDIPDLQIFAQLEVLNEDFRLLNENVRNIPAEFQGIAADTEIEFCLASLDPQGLPTTGINRVQTDIECVADIFNVKSGQNSRLFYSQLGGTDAWDTEHYLNIWVGATCGEFLGTATSISLPNFQPQEDGVVIDFNYFGNNCASSIAEPYHLGRTATHEIGHFFGLRHPWGNCGSDADGVADTPQQETFYFGCPSYPQFSCGSSDMFMNFMNLSDDICMALFTEGQKQRMLASLAGPRVGLSESVGCALLSPIVPYGPEAILLYPNPAEDCIHIDFNADVPGDIFIQMTSASGQIVYEIIESSRNFRSIDASRFADGLYFISFFAAKQTITKKVMVMRD